MWLCIQMPQEQFDLEDGATMTGSMGYGQVFFGKQRNSCFEIFSYIGRVKIMGRLLQ